MTSHDLTASVPVRLGAVAPGTPGVRRGVVRWVVGVAGAVVLWMLFAPAALGGPASYVVTDGTSMLPHFHGDGVVVTHERSSYDVGMVVAYHNAQLHAVVMHRIVAVDGDRYVFKGDNNDFRDQYHAKPSDLVGQEWIYLPGAGRYLRWLHSPLFFGGLVFLITLLGMRSPRVARRRRRHHAS
jgi:signal peptidase I